MTGSSSEMSVTASSARYGSAEKPGSPSSRERLVEHAARDAVSRGFDELRELGRVDRAGSTPVPASWFMMTFAAARRSAPGRDRRLVEPVAAAGDEDVGAVEVERALEPADARGRQLGNLRAQALDELRRRLDRDEVGLGEVAVVVGLLLRAPRR